ncbi:helix-turn-helix domain-containing protein [Rhodococcus sp. NPDC060090]|uniref:helix-turn-helix domain-containing protein n=1 Tax=Rhodococcus sp. NPDC060090 TaxID=3347056 RepID=UPI00364E7DA6
MAEKKNPLGPIGEIARQNVSRLREAQRLTYAELSRQLDDLGRPIAQLGLRRIEAGERRIDVDDLVALAVVLKVSPLALILPTDSSALTPDGPEYRARDIWEWGQGLATLDRTRDPAAELVFLRESNPVMYEQVRAEQEAGKVNSNPVAVGRVIAKRQRQDRRGRLTNGDD